ncbi:MAG: hypothetical protein IJ899_20195 [Blautia sp.]|nr:hypothetical protein [Blautia sp.]
MDTNLIAQYYRETDPRKRWAILQESIKAEEEPERNKIRQDLYAVRYKRASEADKAVPADGYLGLWMLLEYNTSSGGLFGFGSRHADKQIRKKLKELEFSRFEELGGDSAELFYREVCHMVRVYMILCQSDHNYNSTIFGMMKMSDDHSANKLRNDIKDVAHKVSTLASSEKELAVVLRAVTEVYEEFFPGEGGPL